MPACELISGPVLLPFAEAFEECFGKPSDKPLPVVTPAAVGGVLLPFACVFCGEVRAEAVDPITATHYQEPNRGFSWCPSCGGRYLVNRKGAPLNEALEPGATWAPALIDGKTTGADGLALLGCEAAR